MSETAPHEPLETPVQPLHDPDLHDARKNLVMAWSLFALFVLLAAGTVAVVFIYLAAD